MTRRCPDPDCRGQLLATGEHEYECKDCGDNITDATFVNKTAGELRSEGLDDLADRLEAAAKRLREAR